MVSIEDFKEEMRRLNEDLRKQREKREGEEVVRKLGKEDGWSSSGDNKIASTEVKRDYSVVVDMTRTFPLWVHAELYHRVYGRVDQEALEKSYNKLIDIGAVLKEF